jgi:hypothetical protein
MTKRDDFAKEVREVLAKRAGQQCSRPECRSTTSGPHSSPNKAINLGVAAHICGATPKGKRYDPSMTPKERASIDNGIWLCQRCAKLIDSDEVFFTVELLRHWKIEHENSIFQVLLHSGKDIAEFSDLLGSLPSTGSISTRSGLNPKLLVQVTTDSEQLPVYSHISTSSSNPVSITFGITNTSSTLIEYLQIHTWLLYGRLVRDPEGWQSSPWQPQDVERLPTELTLFGNLGSFARYTLSLSPLDRFYLMPSQHPIYLPQLEIQWMSFVGVIPMPWQIETPKTKPIFGVLLLWVSERGIFTSETVPIHTDWKRISQRVDAIRKNYKPDKSEFEFTGIPRY